MVGNVSEIVADWLQGGGRPWKPTLNVRMRRIGLSSESRAWLKCGCHIHPFNLDSMDGSLSSAAAEMGEDVRCDGRRRTDMPALRYFAPDPTTVDAAIPGLRRGWTGVP